MTDIHSIWAEKYRPQTLSECILPQRLYDIFTNMVESKNIQNMIFSGASGCGKTTVARALANDMSLDCLFVNTYRDGNIESLRTKIVSFASSKSLLNDSTKLVIFDEADRLTPVSQDALRSVIEEFSSNCRFIFTCNYPKKLTPAIHSRCSHYKFDISKDELPLVAKKFHKSFVDILEKESIDYNPKAVLLLVKNYMPDWRRILVESQTYSLGGKIDAGILTNTISTNYSELAGLLKLRKFQETRQWLADNFVNDSGFISDMFRGLEPYMKETYIPDAILVVAEYQYKASFVADQEINAMAALTEIMKNVEFK